MSAQLEQGRAYPLGASWDGAGVNFALFSATAEVVELCLYAADGVTETARLPLRARTDEVWHGYFPGAGPGQLYGYRVHGPYDPGQGLRFNAHKLLLDPYARAWSRSFTPIDPADGHALGVNGGEPGFDQRDTGPAMVKAIVTGPDDFNWEEDHPPRTPWSETILYEAHVKGLTRLHPAVPEADRGRYLGLAHPAVTDHLRRLGVTAIELLPLMGMADEPFLRARGQVNYWGYNTLGFFLPDPRYAAADPRRELKTAIKALHAAGIEVILDVVYNHTGEGDRAGPTLSFRGIDNRSYYRLDRIDPSRYENPTGTGNALDCRHPRVIQLIMDSLRWWVQEYHVDGFRFDLATVLAREPDDFDPGAALLDAIAQDPVLQGAKLIAEPWDIGPNGYRVGGFPPGWREWNDGFRDDVRRFWLSGQARAGALADRLAGSSRQFRYPGRTPQAGINFVTAHDGFTLCDLVSYAHKHNDANGEQGRDGHDANHSCNFGAEGSSADPEILARRRRACRSLLATLFLSQGVPMLTAGDEFGHSQGGNNNAWCQDNETTWLDWERADHALCDFVRTAIALRRAQPALRGRDWLSEHEVAWRGPAGEAIHGRDWDGDRLAMLLASDPAKPILLVVNAGLDAADFVLPPGLWKIELETAGEGDSGRSCRDRCTVAAGALTVLARVRADLDPALVARLAQAAGLDLGYHDAFGRWNAPSQDDLEALLAGLGYALGSDADLRAAIEALETSGVRAQASDRRAASACFLPEPLQRGERLWGVSVQLYTVRSRRNWGIGDYADLAALAPRFGGQGADLIGLNPLHARSLTRPLDCSPYAPVSRLCLDTFAIAVDRVPELDGCPEIQDEILAPPFQARLDALRASPSVDYVGVAAVKSEILHRLFARFDEVASADRRDAFAAFVARGGTALESYARFEATRSVLASDDAQPQPWWQWPAIVDRGTEIAYETRFQLYLQFLADEQLGIAVAAAEAAGMRIGLYRDLAVASARDSAEAWAIPALASALNVGAPPDPMGPDGQDWGMPAPDPRALAAAAYQPFTDLLDANMRHAGSLRIDHAMSLRRLFVIPQGRSVMSGTYLAYPFEILSDRLAQASREAGCLVIGEDLGVVPDGFRAAMAARNILAYKVLPFERSASGAIADPVSYPYLSVAMAATHDLPTLAGFWRGRDIVARRAIGLLSPEQTQAALRERVVERRHYLALLEAQGILAPGSIDPEPSDAIPPGLIDIVHRSIARAGSALALVQLDDILGETEAVNLPGTSTEYPNWRRRLALDLEDPAFDAAVAGTAAILRSERGRMTSPG